MRFRGEWTVGRQYHAECGLTFSAANGNQIGVTDLAATGSDTLTLSAANGTLTLGGTTGITFTSGTNGSNSFTISGAIGNLNAALNGLTYQPNFSYTGGDTLTVLLQDPGDSLSATSSVSLTINAISAPEISAPTTAAVIENGTLTFSPTSGYPITLADNGSGTSSRYGDTVGLQRHLEPRIPERSDLRQRFQRLLVVHSSEGVGGDLQRGPQRFDLSAGGRFCRVSTRLSISVLDSNRRQVGFGHGGADGQCPGPHDHGPGERVSE